MRGFLVAATTLLAILAAACSGGGSDVQPVPTSPAAANTPAVVRPETAPALPVTVADKDGKSVTVKDVSRIVVLNGDIAEVIWALGLGDNVVGTDTSATYPEAARAKQSIGYQRTLSAEGIIALNPSLIIGNEAAGPAAVIEQIRGVGIPLLIIKDITTLEGVAEKIRTVAKALGVPVRGDELAAKTQTEIDAAVALAAKAKTQPRVAFLYLRGATVQHILGAGSRGDIIVKAAGGIDIGVEANIQNSKPITPEALAGANPDVYLVLTAGLESVGGVDGLLQIPGAAQTPAGLTKNVIAYDDQLLLGLGPRTGQVLMELVKKLHPELG